MNERSPETILVGQEVSEIIKERGIRRVTLAEQVGVTLDTINNWCSGRTRIEFSHLEKLIYVLEGHDVPWEVLNKLLVKYINAYGLSSSLVEKYLGNRETGNDRARDVVACICGDRRNGTVERVGEAIINGFHRYGFKNLITLDACGRPELLEYYIGEMVHLRPLGVILNGVPQSQASVDVIARVLSKENIPLVLMYCEPDPGAHTGGRVSWISPLNEELSRYACNLLIERGHTKIGIIIQSSGHSRPWCLHGYKRALSDAGLPFDPALAVWGVDYFGVPRDIDDVMDSPSQSQVRKLVQNDEVSGIVATSPVGTLQVITAMRQDGQSWPADKSVVSVGFNEWLNHLAVPPITSVLLPTEAIGLKAVELLMEMCPEFGGEGRGRGIFLSDAIVLNLSNGSVKAITGARIKDPTVTL